MTDTISPVDRLLTSRMDETLLYEDGSAYDLTGHVIVMRLVSGETVVTLTDGSGLGFTDAAAGGYYWETSAADIAALGTPATFSAFLTIFRADASILFKDSFEVGVSW